MSKYIVFNEEDVLPKKGENLLDSFALLFFKILIHPILSYVFFIIFALFFLGIIYYMSGNILEVAIFVGLITIVLISTVPLIIIMNIFTKKRNESWDSVEKYFKDQNEKLLIVLEKCTTKYYNVLHQYTLRSVLFTNKHIYVTYVKLSKILPQVMSLKSSKKKIPLISEQLEYGKDYINSKEWRIKFFSSHINEIKDIIKNEK